MKTIDEIEKEAGTKYGYVRTGVSKGLFPRPDVRVGGRVFYSDKLAAKIVNDLEARKNLLTLTDVAELCGVASQLFGYRVRVGIYPAAATRWVGAAMYYTTEQARQIKTTTAALNKRKARRRAERLTK